MPEKQVIENFRSALLSWAFDNLRRFPWRETTDPYEVLIAEILLQKTAAEKVEPIYEKFISTYPSPAELAEANRDELADIIYSLGFQNQRSKALVSIGQALRGSGVPDDDERLLELPYVGRYAANAILCFAFDEPRPIVDANVVRVYNRIFDTDFDYRDEAAWQFAEEVLSEADPWGYNLAILDFAAEICAPKTPNCEECFFTDQCSYYLSLL
jgi:A/G-specific adenine glycosylase